MKIGVLVPTQGYRLNFLAKCKEFIGYQTLQPDVVEIVDDPSIQKVDLTWRYFMGIQRLKSKVDLISFMEDDDWYSDIYLETLANEWEKAGNPDIIGQHETNYYHLAVSKYWNHKHPGRSSAMATAIASNAVIDYGDMSGIHFDLKIWKQLKGVTYKPDRINCLGIKHGLGNCGGIGHNPNNQIYQNTDKDGSWLKNIVGEKNAIDYNAIIGTGRP